MNKKSAEEGKDQKTKDVSEEILKPGSSPKKLPDILGGVVFISIGVILLLNNFGIVPWIIWLHLAIFWPVVFVFIGLDLLSGNSLGLKVITTTIGVIIFAFILVYSLSAVDSTFKNYLNNHCRYCQNIFSFIQKKAEVNPTRLFYTHEEDVDMGNPIFRD